MVAMTASSSITATILPNGETHLSSNAPWYRLFRAIADLYLAGEIEEEELSEQESHWAVILSSDINKPAVTEREFSCPAAKALLGKIALAMMEPDCPCDPYRTERCDCPPFDRRARLRELIGD